MTAAPLSRHYGMDWLRIGAFGVLILYHVGMVFVPWNFHVKSAHAAPWLTLPMLGVSAWRLSLLFVVSGYASRALLARYAGRGGFLRDRSLRLLVPLIFGMAVIVPPQPWVELVAKHGYRAGFATFWLHDYFRFWTLAGVSLPTWNHLWFVVYLWVYTALLALAVRFAPGARLQRGFDLAFGAGLGGWGVLAWPLLWLVCVHGWWFPLVGESHALFGDWVAHASYLPAFLFGFALAGSPAAAAAIRRRWKMAAGIALLGYAGVLAVELRWPGNTPAPRWVYPPYGVAHALQQWGGIVALIGIAEGWNRDGPARATLTEAVFPFYIVHQTIIVVVMGALLGAGLPGWAEFALLVSATVAGCWAFYRIGRGIRPLRPLIGLRPAPARTTREQAPA